MPSVQMYGMELTTRQKQILAFIEQSQQSQAGTPSVREIAEHFGLSSPGSVADHLRALRRKGALGPSNRKARSLPVLSAMQGLRRPVIDIPIYGEIAAGRPDERLQEAKGCISVDVDSLNIRKTNHTFALEVHGDSMVGKHIVEGDYAIFEHGVTPKTGDVVAALIDNESTLKTFITERGRPFLKAENPKYPKLIPASELVIQGVMVGLIRGKIK